MVIREPSANYWQARGKKRWEGRWQIMTPRGQSGSSLGRVKLLEVVGSGSRLAWGPALPSYAPTSISVVRPPIVQQMKGGAAWDRHSFSWEWNRVSPLGELRPQPWADIFDRGERQAGIFLKATLAPSCLSDQPNHLTNSLLLSLLSLPLTRPTQHFAPRTL